MPQLHFNIEGCSAGSYFVLCDQQEKAKSALLGEGFQLIFESLEVLQFGGLGFLDLLLANRPLSKKMLASASAVRQIPIKYLLPEDIVGRRFRIIAMILQQNFKTKRILFLLSKPNPP